MTSTTERITTYERGGLEFDVLDQGPLDGEIIVLLHGFPQLNTSWSAVAPVLHDAGFRTLAPNQRGYAVGARPHGRRAYRTTELVADVVALIEQLGDRVHLVGHDWGAVVAWAIAAERPELLHTLTAVSVPHPGAFLRSMPRGQILKSWYMAFFNLPWLPEKALSHPTLARRSMRQAGMTREMAERYWHDFGAPAAAGAGPLRGALGWYRALPLSDRSLFGKRVRVPTTHVWSDGDVALSRAGAELTEAYVDGAAYRFEVLEGVSHWIPEQRPGELARVILERATPS